MMKNLPTIIILVLILGVGIWWYQSSSTEVVQITPGVDSGPTLELVNRIRMIHIDTGFFSDQTFLSLEETPALDVSGLATGRPNPFLSLRSSFSSTVPAAKR